MVAKEKMSKTINLTGASADGTTYIMWFNLLAILGKVVRRRKSHQLIQWFIQYANVVCFSSVYCLGIR